MPPSAPHLTACLRAPLPRPRGARAHTCENYAYTCQRLLAYGRQRVHLQPSERCLAHLDAPLVLDFLASRETERGHSPRTRTTRFAAITSFMRCVEYRVPSILEQSRRG